MIGFRRPTCIVYNRCLPLSLFVSPFFPVPCVCVFECRWFRLADWRVLYQVATSLILVAILLPIMMLMTAMMMVVMVVMLLIATGR